MYNVCPQMLWMYSPLGGGTETMCVIHFRIPCDALQVVDRSINICGIELKTCEPLVGL